MKTITQRSAREAIGNREDFVASGLSGSSKRVGPFDSGRLKGADLEAFIADMSDIAYTVLSYATPIAWVTASGRVHYVSQRFSQTTTKQQSLIAGSL